MKLILHQAFVCFHVLVAAVLRYYDWLAHFEKAGKGEGLLAEEEAKLVENNPILRDQKPMVMAFDHNV
jgi:hypothetical protein